jgi:hypothetical protein
MSDYTLLEDVARAAAAAERGIVRLHESGAARSKRGVLAREAARRGVHLYLMPFGFSRRARNSSHIRGKRERRELHWHVDVVFKGPSDERCVFVDACAESTTIASVVAGARDALMRRRKKGCARNALPGAAGGGFGDVAVDRLEVFIRNEHSIGTQDPDHVSVPGKAIGDEDMHRYLLVGKDSTLEAVLNNRVVVEFPILLVALASSEQSRSLEHAMMGVFEKPDRDSETSEYDTSDASDDGGSDAVPITSSPDDVLPVSCRDAGEPGSVEECEGTDATVSIAKRIRLDEPSVAVCDDRPRADFPGAEYETEEMLEVDVNLESASGLQMQHLQDKGDEQNVLRNGNVVSYGTRKITILDDSLRVDRESEAALESSLTTRPSHEFSVPGEKEDVLPPIPRVRAQVPSA